MSVQNFRLQWKIWQAPQFVVYFITYLAVNRLQLLVKYLIQNVFLFFYYLGSTGPVLVFETIVYDICVSMDIKYLSFRFWVHIWTALILFIMVITDASSLVIFIF